MPCSASHLKRLVPLVGVLAPLSGTPASAAYESECQAFLTRGWQERLASHPIAPSRHVVVLSIDSPLGETDRDYRRALDNLKHAFPSFEVGYGSGILAGCCAMPAWGAVSHDELARLSSTRFAALCEVARRSRSTSAAVRVEHREAYEAGRGVESYFFVFWHRPADR